MREGIDVLSMVLEMNVLNGIFYKRKMFQSKYHWVEIKYLGTYKKRHRQLFSHNDNAFSQYTSAFFSLIATRRRELENLNLRRLKARVYSLQKKKTVASSITFRLSGYENYVHGYNAFSQ